MNNLDIKINMLETLYDLASKGRDESFRKFRKYVVAINEDMEDILRYNSYRNAIDKITSLTIQNNDQKLFDAKDAIYTYKRIEDYFSNGTIWFEEE